jgi:HEAT repeat protein
VDGLVDLERANEWVKGLFALACLVVAALSLIPVAYLIRSERSGTKEPGRAHPILGKRLNPEPGVSPIVLYWFFWLSVGWVPALILCVFLCVGAAPISVVLCTGLLLWLGPIVLSWILCGIIALFFWCVDVPNLWRLKHGIVGPTDEDVAWRIATLKGARAVTPLTQALKHDDVRSRRGAARALGEIVDINADFRGALPLIEALNDGDCVVRSNAAHALGKIHDACVLLRNRQNAREAAEALGGIVDAHAALPLIEALRDRDRMVRSNAAQTLGKIQDARALLPLCDLLKDRETDVRRSAAGALGEIVPAAFSLAEAPKDRGPDERRDAVVTALRSALKDPDSDVRRRAAEASHHLER